MSCQAYYPPHNLGNMSLPYSTMSASMPTPSDMATSGMGNATCSPTQISDAMLPLGFQSSSNDAMCGFAYPDHLGPANDLQTCCTGPVMVNAGCFQYCRTNKSSSTWEDCVKKNVQVQDGFAVQCNSKAAGQNQTVSYTGAGSRRGLTSGGWIDKAAILLLLGAVLS